MANPFVAGEGDPTVDLPGAETFNKLRDQWSTFLDQPSGRAALLSFGLQAMQPMGFGQSGAGHFGQAVGAGGEAVGRAEAMDIKQQEAESKAQLREAQAATAGARAGRQGLMADVAREKLQTARTLGQFQAANRLYQTYEAYRNGVGRRNAEIAKRNADVMRDPKESKIPEEPLQDMQTWMQNNPTARDLAVSSGLFGGGATTETPGVGGRAPPQPGETRGGYRFRGGDPGDQNSWEKM